MRKSPFQPAPLRARPASAHAPPLPPPPRAAQPHPQEQSRAHVPHAQHAPVARQQSPEYTIDRTPGAVGLDARTHHPAPHAHSQVRPAHNVAAPRPSFSAANLASTTHPQANAVRQQQRPSFAQSAHPQGAYSAAPNAPHSNHAAPHVAFDLHAEKQQTAVPGAAATHMAAAPTFASSPNAPAGAHSPAVKRPSFADASAKPPTQAPNPQQPLISVPGAAQLSHAAANAAYNPHFKEQQQASPPMLSTSGAMPNATHSQMAASPAFASPNAAVAGRPPAVKRPSFAQASALQASLVNPQEAHYVPNAPVAPHAGNVEQMEMSSHHQVSAVPYSSSAHPMQVAHPPTSTTSPSQVGGGRPPAVKRPSFAEASAKPPSQARNPQQGHISAPNAASHNPHLKKEQQQERAPMLSRTGAVPYTADAQMAAPPAFGAAPNAVVGGHPPAAPIDPYAALPKAVDPYAAQQKVIDPYAAHQKLIDPYASRQYAIKRLAHTTATPATPASNVTELPKADGNAELDEMRKHVENLLTLPKASIPDSVVTLVRRLSRSPVNMAAFAAECNKLYVNPPAPSGKGVKRPREVKDPYVEQYGKRRFSNRGRPGGGNGREEQYGNRHERGRSGGGNVHEGRSHGRRR